MTNKHSEASLCSTLHSSQAKTLLIFAQLKTSKDVIPKLLVPPRVYTYNRIAEVLWCHIFFFFFFLVWVQVLGPISTSWANVCLSISVCPERLDDQIKLRNYRADVNDSFRCYCGFVRVDNTRNVPEI